VADRPILLVRSSRQMGASPLLASAAGRLNWLKEEFHGNA
jgi:hypothetical protein